MNKIPTQLKVYSFRDRLPKRKICKRGPATVGCPAHNAYMQMRSTQRQNNLSQFRYIWNVKTECITTNPSDFETITFLLIQRSLIKTDCFQMDLENSCRLCLIPNKISIDMFSVVGKTLNIPSILAKHFAIEVRTHKIYVCFSMIVLKIHVISLLFKLDKGRRKFTSKYLLRMLASNV